MPPEVVVHVMQVILAVSALIVAGLIVWLTTTIVRQNLSDRRAQQGLRGSSVPEPPGSA
ncbi:MAG: hypothetical protein KDC39_05775 [Actinobacteria bacterium]|nr:hypothetical protein [Actinomycetota bacterium]